MNQKSLPDEQEENNMGNLQIRMLFIDFFFY